MQHAAQQQHHAYHDPLDRSIAHLYEVSSRQLFYKLTHDLGASPEDAEDIIIETYLQFFLQEQAHPGKISRYARWSWLVTTARRLHIDLYRHRAVYGIQEEPYETQERDDGEVVTREYLDQRERDPQLRYDTIIEDIEKALALLSPRDQQLFTWKVLWRWPNNEIAFRLRCAESQVKGKVWYVRERFKQAYAQVCSTHDEFSPSSEN